MIQLVAAGATATTECVHISWRSMVATICGPSMVRMNCGRARVSTEPSAAPPRVMSSERIT